MLLDEHRAKLLFAEAGLPVPPGLRLTADDIPANPPFPAPWYLKSLVLTGGRGKAGGIVRVDDPKDLAPAARKLFATPIGGALPPALRLEPAAAIATECYLSLAVSRDREALVLTASPAGGMDVEAGAAPPLVQAVSLPAGPAPCQVRAAFFRLGLPASAWPAFQDLAAKLFASFRDYGLLLAEINPLALTADGRLLALDAKAEMDGNVLDLKPELARFRDASFEPPEEARARSEGFSYVRLPGHVGLIANGAGLAMASMDLLNFSGLTAANFLDLGGAADQARVRAAFALLFDDPQVRAVFVNLFGGILSCERVALAMREALGEAPPPKPLVVRLAGNGAAAGREVLEKSPLPGLRLAPDMLAALDLLAGFVPRDTAPPRAATPAPTVRPCAAAAPSSVAPFDLPAGAPVLVQGLTGRVAGFHARLMRAYGTNIVAGVTPFKGGQTVDGVPVYDSVAEAARRHDIAASIIFVPAPAAADAVLEAAEAGVRLIVAITEGIPQADMLAALPRVRAAGATLVGPNTPGVIIPGVAKIGIMPAEPFTPGPVAIFSRSGTLTYEAAARLSAAGIGQAYAVGIGGDPFVGSPFSHWLAATRDDPRVAAVLVLGEIGGRAEEDLARFARETAYPKPIAAFIAGRTAPPGKRLGHAGAILEESGGAAAGKIERLATAGITVCPDLAAIPETLARLLAGAA
jgi:succinyl-CoA synthetase alpha subunit